MGNLLFIQVLQKMADNDVMTSWI